MNTEIRVLRFYNFVKRRSGEIFHLCLECKGRLAVPENCVLQDLGMAEEGVECDDCEGWIERKGV